MGKVFVFHKPYPIASDSQVAEIPVQFVRNANKSYQARPSAIRAFTDLHHAAKKDGVEIIVISSYRARTEQTELFLKGEQRHGKGRAILWLAPPGYSEHHTGYVFDLADRKHPETDDELSFETTPAFHWLDKNAARYGFEMSFPKNNWQGVGYEPWHWRFAGDDDSRRIFHPGIADNAARTARAIVNGIIQRIGA